MAHRLTTEKIVPEAEVVAHRLTTEKSAEEPAAEPHCLAGVKSAADARTDPDFFILSRTDALAVEGLQAAIDRACACVEAGADGIFPEAITDLDMYRKFAAAVKVPVLANITEFGQTPLFTVDELASADVAIALYPLSAFRAMNKAALGVYQALRKEGSQKSVVGSMQTREELYHYLGYHEFEKKLDALFAKAK